MKSENPNYAEDALRSCRDGGEKSGRSDHPNKGLPILSKTVDMDYLDSLKRTPKLVPGKIVTEPVMPPHQPYRGTRTTRQCTPFLVQPYSQEQLLDLAQRRAMTAYKKEKALEKVKEAQRRAEVQQSTTSLSNAASSRSCSRCMPETKFPRKNTTNA